MIFKIKIINYANPEKLIFIKKIWNIQHDHTSQISLIIKPHRIELQNNLINSKKNIWVDFNIKKINLYKLDKKIKMIQAIKIKNTFNLNILDATAGLGKDAFIFVSYGYKVTMIERNPILSILLYDGLVRGLQNNDIKKLIKKNINLIYNTTLNIHQLKIQQPDIIYLDPMFPTRKKSLSKKEIRTIQNIVGYDTDADNLLLTCLPFAKKKVVVKRPKKSNYLANIKPNYIIPTKNHRFDIYVK
ncbi:class I SAM-dependent methyltransferase [Buchnera aphidicola]|uniref:Ribosomal RNA small subunit methyltransferase J n=1 Tax=Buchnera aphidicola (Sarucallis kahawaluokalani) TaxID=1241878 RepID=A0A4D6Y8C1_9GAMM|nr:class I SAM-dependent methyltransferase [Buchnera aphidicola]QCI26176.1 16S rRNA methyltransferase [Buchnera aphidicola (Sarucallis kahawaluokalani)]